MRDHARMNAYSEDPRKKIVEALGRGTTKSEAARSFGVSRSSVKRYAKPAEEGRPLAPKKRPGLKPKLDEAARRPLEEDLEERPAATLRQRREFLRAVAGVSVSESTVSRALGRLGWSRKKIAGSGRARRVLEGRLAGDGRRRPRRRRAAGVRRRDGRQRLAPAALRLVAQGEEGLR
jgi:transposase